MPVAFKTTDAGYRSLWPRRDPLVYRLGEMVDAGDRRLTALATVEEALFCLAWNLVSHAQSLRLERDPPAGILAGHVLAVSYEPDDLVAAPAATLAVERKLFLARCTVLGAVPIIPTRGWPAADIELLRPAALELRRTWLPFLPREHGVPAWLAVARRVAELAQQTPGCDRAVCDLFAVLHDSQRRNEGHDPEHGARAAAFARQLRQASQLALDGGQLELLEAALVDHDRGYVTSDPTLAVCWEAAARFSRAAA